VDKATENPYIWTGALIQALLDWDSEQENDPTHQQVMDMVSELKLLCARLEAIRTSACPPAKPTPPKSKYRAFIRYFVRAVQSLKKESGESGHAYVIPESEEDQFYEILRLWRLEHPEPVKRTFPTGHLGREDD
jgi:hypothetical protein